jgi:putative ABC transport system permease protein
MPLTALTVAFAALRANPLRTLLSTLGVVIGAAALVAVLSVGDGVEGYARTMIERQGFTAISITARTNERIDGVSAAVGDWPQFGAADVAALRTVIPASAQVVLKANTTLLTPLTPGGERRGLFVEGLVATAIPRTLSTDIVHGRAPTPDELAAGASVAVINDTLARVLADDRPEAAVGQAIMLGAQSLRVIGVTTKSMLPFFQVTVPLAMAERVAVDRGRFVPTLEVIVAEAAEVDSVRRQLETYATGRPDWNTKVRVSATGVQRLAAVEEGMLIFKLAMGAFASISLIVGGIGIMNVLLAAVAERTREIGIRKATGATNRDILVQFLAESVAITSVGSAIGVAVGLSGAMLVTWIMRSRTEALVYAAVTWQTMLTCAVIAVVIGLVFGMVPALRAARLSPIDAIRHE